MKLIQIYTNVQGTAAVFLPEEEEFILIRLRGKVDHASYKAVFENLYQYIGIYKYKKVIYDLKGLTHTEEQSRTWFVTSFLPKVIRNLGTGFKTATIRPENEFENASVDFLTELGRNLGFTNTIRLFTSKEQAIDWILDKKTPSLSSDEVSK